MYHTIEFAVDSTVGREVSGDESVVRVLIQKGTRMHAELRPYVAQTRNGLVEFADLFTEDECVLRMVPYACFTFVD